jgi:uncharacterized protein YegP (UPF0339 family)
MNPPEIYRRTDGRWAWRLKATNGQVVATDGGQGYENHADVETIVTRLFPRVTPITLTEDQG